MMPYSVIEDFGIGKKDSSMNRMVFVGAVSLFLAACSRREPLVVRQFTLREIDPNWTEDLMIRGEIQKRLYGAVEWEEREKRKGQYYSVRWRANPANGEVKIRFQYQQGSTGSQVHELVQRVAPDGGTGVVEFAIAGDVYAKGGPVTAWRMELSQGGLVLGEEKSFLWE